MPTSVPFMPTLYLIRHGETDFNARRLLQGRLDIPLNDTGRQQAALSGLCLKNLVRVPESVDFIASPLHRTRETMEIVRARLGLPLTGYATDERLMEIAFGEWEGIGWTDVQRDQPDLYEARFADPVNFIPQGGENYPMVFERVASLVRSLQRDTVVVAHAGILRSFMALLAGISEPLVPLIEIPQDQVLILQDGGFTWLRASSALDGRVTDWADPA
jgi:broad specificity phosphatase PhoE